MFPDAGISQASNGQNALNILETDSFDLVILDVQMPGMNGPQALAKIKDDYPATKVIMFTQYDNTALVSHCVKLGANAFLLKDGNIDEIQQTITKVIEDGNYFSPFVANIIRKTLNSPSAIANLSFSQAELQILSLLKEGEASKEIAAKTSLTSFTVDTYRKRLLQKTKTKNVVELIALAFRTGIFTTSEKNIS
jgi:DNA-binding NarL/FixJ family response regulator